MMDAVFAAGAFVWSGLTAGAAVSALARSPRASSTRSPFERVLLVRPCAGAEPDLRARLESALPWARARRATVRFAVASELDPAVPDIHAATVTMRAAGVDAELVVAPPLGPNRKTSQLAAAAPPGAFDAVINADSDVDLGGLDLDALLAPLADGAGACWAPPVERGPVCGLGDRASQAVLGGSIHSFPMLCVLDPAGLVGKLFAVRGDALEEAGGFRGLVRHLGEDVELARRLIAGGWRVVAGPLVAPSMVRGRSLTDVVARFARWLQVIKAQRAALMVSYPLMFFCAPLQVGLALLAWPHPMAQGALAVALLGRLLVALGAARRAGRSLAPASVFTDIALSDLTLILAWSRAIATRRFLWRGVPLRIGRGGELQTDER